MLDRRVLPALAVLVPLLAVALARHLLETTAWVTPFETVISTALFAAAIATTIGVCARIRWLSIGVPIALVLANTAFMIGRTAGLHLGPLPGPDPKFAIVLCAAMLLGVVGLIARRQWARWLMLAFGAAAIGCGGLNAVNFWTVSGTVNLEWREWYYDMCRMECFYFVTALGGALIVVNLIAARDRFVANPTWNRPEPVVRWLRASMIATFVAVPMLLVYAWMQPLVPATKTTALVLASVLTVGAVLGVRGKLAGALLLVFAGLGLAVQTAATLHLAQETRIAIYYAFFWMPAAVIAIVTGGLLVRPTLRLLRR
ncbi:MAG TPA: hypothetical protein VLB44_18840 [Kofleriaceae bacterium]|nr:hypothetical protein [Kofleriaceae bacterium]